MAQDQEPRNPGRGNDMAQADEPSILENPLKFKEMLGMGEDTYKTLRVRKKLSTVLGAAGAGSAGALVASSSAVATSFFPASGFLAALGLGAAAATPIGWVAGAGALAGGTYLGAKKLVGKFGGKFEDEMMSKTPKDLDTSGAISSEDGFARIMLMLMLPLSLESAKTWDDQITASAGEVISDYYAGEWGYSKAPVDAVMKKVESLGNVSYAALAAFTESLVEFSKTNKDRNRDIVVVKSFEHLKEWGYSKASVDEVLKGLGNEAHAYLAAFANSLVKFCNTNEDCNRDAIAKSFHEHLEEWGYSKASVDAVMKKVESLGAVSYAYLANSLVKFCDTNENCNRDAIAKSFHEHLENLIEKEEDPWRRKGKMTVLGQCLG